jgi:hypothetical protein
MICRANSPFGGKETCPRPYLPCSAISHSGSGFHIENPLIWAAKVPPRGIPRLIVMETAEIAPESRRRSGQPIVTFRLQMTPFLSAINQRFTPVKGESMACQSIAPVPPLAVSESQSLRVSESQSLRVRWDAELHQRRLSCLDQSDRQQAHRRGEARPGRSRAGLGGAGRGGAGRSGAGRRHTDHSQSQSIVAANGFAKLPASDTMHHDHFRVHLAPMAPRNTELNPGNTHGPCCLPP